jgi:hypothetical protein
LRQRFQRRHVRDLKVGACFGRLIAPASGEDSGQPFPGSRVNVDGIVHRHLIVADRPIEADRVLPGGVGDVLPGTGWASRNGEQVERDLPADRGGQHHMRLDAACDALRAAPSAA